MKNQQLDVLALMRAAGQEIGSTPKIPNEKIQKLRVRLIEEECDELAVAFIENNIVDTADAIADLLYVVLGAAVACGIDIEPVFTEVHRSNMTKFKDGYLRDDGKWIKGPSYDPARIRPILEQQAGTSDF